MVYVQYVVCCNYVCVMFRGEVLWTCHVNGSQACPFVCDAFQKRPIRRIPPCSLNFQNKKDGASEPEVSPVSHKNKHIIVMLSQSFICLIGSKLKTSTLHTVLQRLKK